MKRRPAPYVGGAVAVAVAGYAAALLVIVAHPHHPGAPAAPARAAAAALTGTVSRSWSAGTCDTAYACWVCKRPVDLDLVRVVVDTSDDRVDAVKLAAGCTGRIGRLEVEQGSGDGVKVAEGAHDLEVDGGTVRCVAKYPAVHQDALQALGGDRITLLGVRLDCGRPGASLVDANFRVAEGGSSTSPPADVVCDGCWLGPDAAHTVDVQDSTRSGVRGSTVCPARYPRLTFTIGPAAADPVHDGNVAPTSCGG